MFLLVVVNNAYIFTILNQFATFCYDIISFSKSFFAIITSSVFQLNWLIILIDSIQQCNFPWNKNCNITGPFDFTNMTWWCFLRMLLLLGLVVSTIASIIRRFASNQWHRILISLGHIVSAIPRMSSVLLLIGEFVFYQRMLSLIYSIWPCCCNFSDN